MKKFWKIKNDSNKRFAFEHLRIPDEYIKLLMSPDSSLSDYLYRSKNKYFFICYDSSDKTTGNDGFCWLWFETVNSDYLTGYNYLIKHKYKYKGEINLRRLKLEKLDRKKLTKIEKILYSIQWKI